jgi:methylmalonyl-CoA/ethylmalonyl-CoA epimerase
MKVLRINHLGIAPKQAETAKHFFGNILKLANDGEETVPDQKVKVSFYQTEKSRLEILEPTEDASPVAKFLSERGGGIQHLALEVDDLDAWLVKLKAEGIQLIDSEPRYGAHNTRIAFIHPRSTGGVLVELTQEMKGH